MSYFIFKMALKKTPKNRNRYSKYSTVPGIRIQAMYTVPLGFEYFAARISGLGLKMALFSTFI